MIAGKIESKILTKDIPCECKCKFDGRNLNLNQNWNSDKCRCECINIIYVKKIIFENGKYLASIFDDSITTCDDVTEETKTVPTNFNKKIETCKTQNLFFYLHCYYLL